MTVHVQKDIVRLNVSVGEIGRVNSLRVWDRELE